MAYIGKTPVIGNFVKLDAITAVNGQAAYTMQNGGSNFTDYESVNQFLVSLNGTIQAPTDSFTVSGSTLTFASNLSTGDVIDFIMVFGNSLSAGTPTDATVTTAKLADSAVTAAKITDATITSAKLASGTVQNQSAFKNIIINGDMRVAQRTTSASGVTTQDGYKAVDRFKTQTDTGTWTISQSTDVPTGQGFINSLKLDCTSAGTSNADEVGIRINNEGTFVQHLKYGTSSAESLTLSFWIKTNKTGTYTVAFKNVSSVQERIVSFEYTVSSANTWEKKTVTLPGDTSQALENTTNGEFEIYWYFSAAFGSGVTNTWQNYSAGYLSNGSLPGLGGSTDDELYMTGVQLEIGSTASDFEFLPFDVNLRRCQRYYQKFDDTTAPSAIYAGRSYGTSDLQWCVPLSCPLRASPSVSLTGTLRAFHGGGYNDTTGSMGVNHFVANQNLMTLNSTGFSGITDNRIYNVAHINNTILELDSELL